MKIIGICGEPASGKSTIVRNFIATLSPPAQIVKEGLIVYTIYPEDKVIVAGKYEEGTVFSGTDVLSKGAGPTYRNWLASKNADSKYDNYVFVWEGERFSNSKFFHFFYNECPGVTVYYLQCDEETLNERNANRSNQNDSWRKGMKTRMNNLCREWPVEKVAQGFALTPLAR